MVRLGGEGVGGEGGPDGGEAHRFADRPHQRAAFGGTALGRCALVFGGAEIGPVGEADQRQPAGDQLDPGRAQHRPGDEKGGAGAGKGEERREEEAGLRLAVVEMGVAKPLAARVGTDALIRQLGRFQFLRVDIQGNGRVVHGILHPAGLPRPYAQSFDGVLRTGRNVCPSIRPSIRRFDRLTGYSG